MSLSGKFLLTFLVSVLAACAVAESNTSRLAIFSPYEVTMTQDSVKGTNVRFPPSCGRLSAKGNLEAIDEKNSKPKTVKAPLTEFCNDPWAFRLNKSYVILYESASTIENQILNASEVILWDNEGIYVEEEPWLVQVLPVGFKTIKCVTIKLGPFPGMTDFDEEDCIRFDAAEFLSKTAIADE